MSKQIDINGLAEFKKKCDETYAKIGQGGGSGATTINYTGELESVETMNLIVQYLNEKGLEGITNIEPLSLVNEERLEFYYILPSSCVNSREFYMLADSMYGKYVFGYYETSNGLALKKYWHNVDIVEWFNEKLDITKAQKTGGQKLTWKEEIDPILVESFVSLGFIPYYNAICNMSGVNATYRLLPIVIANGGFVFSNRITTLDQGVPREQVFLLYYDGVAKETTFLVYDISQ